MPDDIIALSNKRGERVELSPSGAETVLYTFTGNADGGIPDSALSWDDKGNLYGTAYYSGDGTCACGLVFELFHGARDEARPVFHKFVTTGAGGCPFRRRLCGAGPDLDRADIGSNANIERAPGTGYQHARIW